MSGKRRTRAWLERHRADPYVRQARAGGLRSRSAFKLLQIAAAERLFRSGMTVVDLGAAPGGWSQVAVEKVGAGGRVLALDRLPIEPIDGVEVVHGDFADAATRDALVARLGGRSVDLVLSDMAPDLSGIKDRDQALAAALAAAVLEFCGAHLAARGTLLMKLFQGADSDDPVAAARERFARVKITKPKASRARSAETYLLARGAGGIF